MQRKKKCRASQNWRASITPKKIKTQLITTIDSVVQKKPNQTLMYINILMHIQNPKWFTSQLLMEEKFKLWLSIMIVIGSFVNRSP